MEKDFYHFEYMKSLLNIPELQLQEYFNILKKKLKEECVVHRFRDSIHMTAVSICFITQCRLIYEPTLIPGDVYIPSRTHRPTCFSVRAGRWLKVISGLPSSRTPVDTDVFVFILHNIFHFLPPDGISVNLSRQYPILSQYDPLALHADDLSTKLSRTSADPW